MYSVKLFNRLAVLTLMVSLFGLLLSSVFTTSVSASSSSYKDDHSSYKDSYSHDSNNGKNKHNYDSHSQDCNYSDTNYGKSYSSKWRKLYNDKDNYYKKGDWNNYNKTLSDINNACWEDWNDNTYSDSTYHETSYYDENCYYDNSSFSYDHEGDYSSEY